MAFVLRALPLALALWFGLRLPAVAQPMIRATVATPAPGHNLGLPLITTAGNALHAFHVDYEPGAGRSRLRWSRPNLDGWTWTTIDGENNPLWVASEIAPVVWIDGSLHIFFIHWTGNTGVLRHGFLYGTTWGFENLDGFGVPGGAGRTTNSLGGTQLGAMVVGNRLYVSYFDSLLGDLRLAEYWSQWTFRTVDGHSTAGGRVTSRVGEASVAVIHNGVPTIIYTGQAGVRRLRMQGITTFDTLPTPAGGGPLAVITSAGYLHVFHTTGGDVWGTINHAWVGVGGWSAATHIAGEGISGRSAACRLDPDTMYIPYVSFYGYGSTLKVTSSYATSAWSTVDVEADAGSAWNVSCVGWGSVYYLYQRGSEIRVVYAPPF